MANWGWLNFQLTACPEAMRGAGRHDKRDTAGTSHDAAGYVGERDGRAVSAKMLRDQGGDGAGSTGQVAALFIRKQDH